MKEFKTIINQLIDKALWECVLWPDPRSAYPRSSKAGKPGEYILKLPQAERDALKELRSEHLQHRIPEAMKAITSKIKS